MALRALVRNGLIASAYACTLLAGCGSDSSGGNGGAGGGGGGGGTGGTGGDTGTTDAPYKDGTYTADGSYQAPSGRESITVTLTLASDKVTAVKIGTHATDPNARQYQAMFASGISSVVVGKDIDSLGVTRVAGSSLTSGGFRVALAAIEKQAAES